MMNAIHLAPGIRLTFAFKATRLGVAVCFQQPQTCSTCHKPQQAFLHIPGNGQLVCIRCDSRAKVGL
jgi:hypothetical protein